MPESSLFSGQCDRDPHCRGRYPTPWFPSKFDPTSCRIISRDRELPGFCPKSDCFASPGVCHLPTPPGRQSQVDNGGDPARFFGARLVGRFLGTSLALASTSADYLVGGYRFFGVCRLFHYQPKQPGAPRSEKNDW